MRAHQLAQKIAALAATKTEAPDSNPGLSANMDINNINSRLKRLYNALGKRYEVDINSNVRRITKTGRSHISFSLVPGNHSNAELENRVFGIINIVASFKYHLKRKLKEDDKNPEIVETMINESLEFQLLLDLWNQDKHGPNRSGKNPKVRGIQQVFEMHKAGDRIGFNIGSGKVTSSGDSNIVITGDIVDENDKQLMSLDKMIDISVENIEKLVRDSNV